RDLLKKYITKIPDLVLVGVFKAPRFAKDLIAGGEVDLIFLDIQMPEISGLDFVKKLTPPSMIIFTTAYPIYAVDGFDLEAIDYLVKPFRLERFEKAVKKAVKRFELEQDQLKWRANQSPKELELRQDFILVKSEYKVYKLQFEDIFYVEGMREYVAFHLSDRKILSLMSLKKLEDLLPSEQFLRVHKSFIINQSKITSMQNQRIFIDEKIIPIGIRYRKKVQERIFLM
ncbi:MAG: LytTR family DNA-binding domain-containing protein, partial [Bacteroidota bacterium]